MTIKFALFGFMALIAGTLSALGENYVTIGKAGKVFDEANNKYITINQKNQDVNIIPGMVFKSSERVPGWIMVEYSPGLRAFVPESIVTADLSAPAPGIFKIANNPSQEANITNSDDIWSITVNGKKFNGKKFGNVVIFTDDSNNVLFSLVDFGEGPTVMTYDNSVTNFF